MDPTENAMASTILTQYDKGTLGKKRSRALDKIAAALGMQRDAVMEYIEEKQMELKEPKHIVDSKKKKKETTSMTNYNLAWLNQVKDAEIHPAFLPCDHDNHP
eukprot:scaffold94630_cov27-Attheya_sp.AAC.2